MEQNELYRQIDTAQKYAIDPQPVVDHGEQASHGLDWASRQKPQPKPAPIKPMAPIVPVAN